MKQALWTLAMVIASTSWAMAQAPVIEFEHLEHNFGTFKEEAGPQRHTFTFTNRGKTPLNITSVQASCGCTTPDWTKESIAPGKKGTITAEYNPAGRPGAFNKTLTVTNNSQTPTVVLRISGVVKEKEKTIADLLPREVADFRLQSEYLNMGRIAPSKGVNKQTFKIYNKSTKTITFNPVAPSARHIALAFKPAVLKPEQTGEIEVSFDTKLKSDFGYTNDAVKVSYAGGDQAELQLYVVGTVEEDPRTLTDAEKGKVPTLTFDAKEHDFGTLSPGDIVSHEFVFTNTGSQPLEIFKTKASCGCTAGEPSKKVLAKGDKANIKVTFNSTGKHDGPQNQTVTIYSNDPAAPTQYISIKAQVDSKKPKVTDLMSKPKPMIATEPSKGRN